MRGSNGAQAHQPRASARYRYPRSNGGQAHQPRASARCRWQRVALTCEVCGDPVRTTFSRPVVTTVLTTVPRTRPNVTTCVSTWFARAQAFQPRASARFRCLGSAKRQPDIDGTVSHLRARLAVTPSGPRSHDPWSRPRRPWRRHQERDHVRERVVQTGRRPTSLGRQPDSDVTDQTGRSSPASGVISAMNRSH